MPNHIHLIMVPQDPDGLRCAPGEAYRRYTREINLRNGWWGHRWPERFHSFPRDQPYLMAAARYIENNPVRAGLCAHLEDWPWSSARAHLLGQDDALVKVGPMLELIPDWRDCLRQPDTPHRRTRSMPTPKRDGRWAGRHSSGIWRPGSNLRCVRRSPDASRNKSLERT